VRNDGRVWVPNAGRLRQEPCFRPGAGSLIIFWNENIQVFRQLAPRDILAGGEEVCDEDCGVGPGGLGVLPGFCRCDPALSEGGDPRALRQPVSTVYEKITGENACQSPDAQFIRAALMRWVEPGWIII